MGVSEEGLPEVERVRGGSLYHTTSKRSSHPTMYIGLLMYMCFVDSLHRVESCSSLQDSDVSDAKPIPMSCLKCT